MARGFLVLVACVIQYLHQTRSDDHAVDLTLLAGLAESFSFGEIRKKSLQTRFCSVVCDTVSAKDTLLNYGDIILPMG